MLKFRKSKFREISPSQWDKTIDVLIEGLPPEKTIGYIKLLNNQFKHMLEFEKTCADPSYAGKMSFIIPIVTRIISNIRMKNIIGFYPIPDPISEVFVEDNPSSALEKIITVKRYILDARWTFITKDDLANVCGLSLESERSLALAMTIANEIDKLLLEEVSNAAKTVLIGDSYFNDNMLKFIITECENLSKKSGMGNIIIMPQRVYKNLILQDKHGEITSRWRKCEKDSASDEALELVGDIHNGSKLFYVSKTLEDDEIIIAHKGKKEQDSGLIYNPMLLAGIQCIHPETHNIDSHARLYTDYGVFKENNYTDFYTKIKLLK